MNPGQVGLGSSWPGSARPGQLGLMHMFKICYMELCLLMGILILKDCSNVENINFVSFIFQYFAYFSFYFYFHYMFIFTRGFYIHFNFDAINCTIFVVTKKKLKQ